MKFHGVLTEFHEAVLKSPDRNSNKFVESDDGKGNSKIFEILTLKL